MLERGLKQKKYMTWLATPHSMRPSDLKTRTAMARRLEVDEDTLSMWELDQGFWDDVFTQARSVIGREMVPIMEEMARRAQKGSVQAAKFCFQILGVHSDKVEIKNTYDDDQLVLISRSHGSSPPVGPAMGSADEPEDEEE